MAPKRKHGGDKTPASADAKINKIPGAVRDDGGSSTAFAKSFKKTHANFSAEKVTVNLDKKNGSEEKFVEEEPSAVIEPEPEPKAEKPKKGKKRVKKVAAADDQPEAKPASGDQPEGKPALDPHRKVPTGGSSCNIL